MMRDLLCALPEATRRLYPHRTFRRIVVAIQAVTILLIVAPLLIALAAISDDIASDAETDIAPVVSKVLITRTEPFAGGVRFWGTATKLRSCRWDRLEWSLVLPDGSSVMLPLKIEEPPKVRAGGEFSFGPWWVPVSADDLLHHSRAVAVHTCHWGWTTRSTFWPSGRE